MGIGLAALLVAVPVVRQLIMPAAITLRNVPYVALVTVLSLALGDTLGSKVAIVVLAGFFPVLVNTYRGLLAADPVALDRMRVLSASPRRSSSTSACPTPCPTSSPRRRSPEAAASSWPSPPSG